MINILLSDVVRQTHKQTKAKPMENIISLAEIIKQMFQKGI